MNVEHDENNIKAVFCPNCGKQFNSTLNMCPFCGAKNPYASEGRIMRSKKSTFPTVKMVIGVVTLCFFVLFFFQSCAVFSLGSLVNQNTSASGLLGVLGALCFMIAGILVIVAKNREEKGINYTAACFYWVVFFFGCMARSGFPDALVWGVVGYIFGTIILFFLAKTKKSRIITIIVSAIYFVLGMI